MKNDKTKNEGKVVSAANAASAGGSIIGAHNICHSICMAAVALLSVFGVVIASDALMFLESFALPFWTMGIAFLGISIFLYTKYCCISKKLLVFNAGLLIIGIPFVQTLSYAWVFWITGIIISGYASIWYFSDKYKWNLGGFSVKKINKESIALYGMLGVVAVILIFSVYTMLAPKKLEINAQNYQQYEEKSLSSANECGDLTDPSNIQHLSHHAELKPCLDKVDPALRKQVLG